MKIEVRRSAEYPIARESREYRPWPASPHQHPLTGKTGGPVYLPPEYAYMQDRTRLNWERIAAVAFCLAVWFVGGYAVMLLYRAAFG